MHLIVENIINAPRAIRVLNQPDPPTILSLKKRKVLTLVRAFNLLTMSHMIERSRL